MELTLPTYVIAGKATSPANSAGDLEKLATYSRSQQQHWILLISGIINCQSIA